MRERLFVIISILLLAMAITAGGETESGNPQKSSTESTAFRLDDVKWLCGYWVGEGFGGLCEEFWSQPSGGSMLGMFKMSVGGEAQFYEIFTMTIDSTGRPVIKLKHFNADLTGWEEKNDMLTFPYEEDATDQITLGAVTYRKVGSDSLHIDVRLEQKDGKINTETIKLARVKL